MSDPGRPQPPADGDADVGADRTRVEKNAVAPVFQSPSPETFHEPLPEPLHEPRTEPATVPFRRGKSGDDPAKAPAQFANAQFANAPFANAQFANAQFANDGWGQAPDSILLEEGTKETASHSVPLVAQTHETPAKAGAANSAPGDSVSADSVVSHPAASHLAAGHLAANDSVAAARANQTPAGLGAMASPRAPEADAERPRLVCLEGPDLGREFVLEGRDLSIGRGDNNDIVVNDPSLSRQHCRLLLTGADYIVTDLRSANGTFVNGRRIDRAALYSGATLRVGETTFRFVEMGDVVKSVESRPVTMAHTGRSTAPVKVQNHVRVALWIVGSAAVMAVVIIATSDRLQSAMSGAKKPTATELIEAAQSAAYSALRQKDIPTAISQFEFALATAKQAKREADITRLSGNVRSTLLEQKNLAHMASAETLRQKGLLTECARSLASVDEHTIFVTDLSALREACGTPNTEPEPAPETPAKEKKNEKLAQTPKSELPSRETSPRETTLRETTLRETTLRESSETSQKTLALALAQFGSGQLAAAQHTLSMRPEGAPAEAVALLGKINKFALAYEEQKKALERASADPNGRAAALPAIKKALQLEAKIGAENSHYRDELALLAADVDCDAASVALSGQRYLEAWKFLKDAQTWVPSHFRAGKRLAEITARAHDLFNEGYIIKDSDLPKAKEKWRLVMTMVPSDNESYQKAKKWLDLSK